MERLAAAIETQPGARLPGQRRWQARQRSQKHGVDIPLALTQQFGPVG